MGIALGYQDSRIHGKGSGLQITKLIYLKVVNQSFMNFQSARISVNAATG